MQALVTLLCWLSALLIPVVDLLVSGPGGSDGYLIPIALWFAFAAHTDVGDVTGPTPVSRSGP